MRYQYEKFILSLLTSLAIKKENKGYYVISDEVEDIYDKARAFDEIVKLRNSYYTYSKRDSGGLIALLDAKAFGREASHLINKKGYTEEK